MLFMVMVNGTLKWYKVKKKQVMCSEYIRWIEYYVEEEESS